MKKKLILYKSKSGHSEEYAKLFAKHLYADIEQFNKFKKEYQKYNEIFYFGGLYIGGINGFKLFKKKILDTQEIYVFPIGASAGRQNELDEIYKHNFTDDEIRRFHIKYLRGGFDFNKCTIFDKFLMTLLKWKLKAIKNPTGDQIGLLNSYEKSVNFVNEKKVLEYLKDIQQ